MNSIPPINLRPLSLFVGQLFIYSWVIKESAKCILSIKDCSLITQRDNAWRSGGRSEEITRSAKAQLCECHSPRGGVATCHCSVALLIRCYNYSLKGTQTIALQLIETADNSLDKYKSMQGDGYAREEIVPWLLTDAQKSRESWAHK